MRILIIILSLFSVSQTMAQKTVLNIIKDPVEVGDQRFNEFSYAAAIDSYKKGLASSDVPEDTIEIKIAESYRMLNQPENAAEWYEKVLDKNTQAEDKYILHYAEALSSQKKYAEAKQWYEIYNKQAATDSRGDKKLTTLENQKQLYRNEASVTVSKAVFNADAADFSPTITEGGIVFVSSRSSKNPLSAVFNWDESNYLDLFIYTNRDQVKRLDKGLNSKLHEGPAVFYANDKKVIFTRNNHEKGKVNTSEEGITKLKLFYAEQNADGKWSDPAELSFNSDEYSVGHPAISADGQTLYFASDMPGGQGGVDIYKTNWENESWQAPVNMGSQINTEGNELFPTLSNDSDLYFASNGHGGLGGLDIFVTDITKNTFLVSNVGAPINSPLDDFGMIMLENGKSGYFSSNREGSGNKDDIYAFETSAPLVAFYTLSGTIKDKRGSVPLPGALIYLVNDQGTVIKTVKSDSLGKYSMTVEPDQTYEVQAGKNEYLKDEKSLATTGPDDQTNWEVNLTLSKDYGFNLRGVVTDKSSQEILQGVAITLIDNLTNETVLNEKTSSEGLFKYKIESYEIEDRISYQIKLEKDGYLSKALVLNKLLDTPGQINLNSELDLTLDKLEIGADIGKLIDIQPIYFDVGKYAIRPDAANELDKVVKIMNENSGIEIELGSHTDSRGSASSNLRLSDKRAKASAQYIISQGIDEARIVGKGYGEEQLINKCSDGVPCSAEEHQLNRRTEFKITKF